MENCDILIIGAGIAGLSAAYELSSSARVIVLERESQPGYHTTGRSAAIYTQNYGNREIRALTMDSHGFFTSPPQDFAEHPLLSARGALFIARDDQLDTLNNALETGQSLVSDIRRVNTAEALEINSALDSDYVAAAIYEPGACDIDVHGLHNGYRKGLLKRGGQVATHAEVMEISRNEGLWKVVTKNGDYCTPVLINAAGAWGDIIAELAGVQPAGLIPKRRTVFTFSPPENLNISSWPLTIDIDEEFYFKPDAGQILASPADETPSPACDAQPEELDIAIAVDRVQTATTLQVRRITNKWAGLRSFVSDKTPVIGMDDEIDGFFWLVGQGGYGIQTAPAIAKAVAALITTGELPETLAAKGLCAKDLSVHRLRIQV